MPRVVTQDGIEFPQDNRGLWTVDPRSSPIGSLQFNFIRNKLTYMKGVMGMSGIQHLRLQQLDNDGRLYDIELFNGVQRVRVFPLPDEDDELETIEMFPAFVWTGDQVSDGAYFLQVDIPPNAIEAFDHLKAYAKNSAATYYSLLATETGTIVPHATVEDLYIVDPIDGSIGEWDWKNDGDIITWKGLDERHYLDWADDPLTFNRLSTSIYYRGDVLITVPEKVVGAGLEFEILSGETERTISKINAITVTQLFRVSWYQYQFFPTSGAPRWIELWFDDGHKSDMELLKQGAYFNSDCSQVTWVTGNMNDAPGIASMTCDRFVATPAGITQKDSGSMLLRAIITGITEASNPNTGPTVSTFSNSGVCTSADVPGLSPGNKTTTGTSSSITCEELGVFGDVHLASDFSSSDSLVSAEIKEVQPFTISGALDREDFSGSWNEAKPDFLYQDPFTPSPPVPTSIFIVAEAVYANHVQEGYEVTNSYSHNRHVTLSLPGNTIDLAKMNTTVSNTQVFFEDDATDPVLFERIAVISGGGDLSQADFDFHLNSITTEMASHAECTPTTFSGGVISTNFWITRERDAYDALGTVDGFNATRDSSASLSGTASGLVRMFGLDLRYNQYSYITSSVSAAGSDTFNEVVTSPTASFSLSSGQDVSGTSIFTMHVVDGGTSSSVALGSRSGSIGSISATDLERVPSNRTGALVNTLPGTDGSGVFIVEDEPSASTTDTNRNYAPFNKNVNSRDKSEYFFNAIRGDSLSVFNINSAKLGVSPGAALLGAEEASLDGPLDVKIPAWDYIGGSQQSQLSPADTSKVLLNGSEANATSTVPWLKNTSPTLKDIKWSNLKVY